MRISTNDLYQRTGTNFNHQESQLYNIQAKISTGKRILEPSDDPIGSTQALNLRHETSMIQQYQRNIDVASNSLEYEDAVLDSIEKIYQRVRELTIQAGNGSLTNLDRNSIAAELEERLDELLDLVNSRNANGDYIFSGFDIDKQAVIRDINGNYVFQGDEGQKSIIVGSGSLVNVTDSAKAVFFNIPTDRVNGVANKGLATFTTVAAGLVNAGTLNPLSAVDLKINNIAIPATKSDGVSTSDATASAIAIANAINNVYDQHQVRAVVNSNTFNLGVFTPNPVATNNLVINGVDIVDAIGSEATLITAINAATEQTGVTVSQPGGAGTALILTASDGRNIQLQTNGTSTANFANFNLTAGALNQVQKSTITLRSHQAYTIGGANPAYAGLMAGTTALSTNTGTGAISQPVIISTIADTNQTYSIVFNAGGTTYNIVDDANPSQPLAGFANLPYVQGQDIEFNGVKVNITGLPNAGDIFGITFETLGSQDIFTSIKNIITNIKTISDPIHLSYQIGLGIDNLAFAEEILLQTRAKVGARLNIVESQKSYHETLKILAETSLSQIQDLDYSTAITELSQYSFALQAAQQSFIKVQSLNIFNFLK